MCDSGYYKLYGICKKCDGTALVTFLALVVPVVAVLGGTLFVFWACTPRALLPLNLPLATLCPLQQRAKSGC